MMEKNELIIIVVVVLVVGVLFYLAWDGGVDIDEIVDGNVLNVPAVLPVAGEGVVPVEVVMESADDFGMYNYDFVDENVKGILNSMIGEGRVAFYLPPVDVIDVSRGSGFGIAFALNNPNPSGENYFEYEWTVDESVVESCGVSVGVGQGWIERGWKSWGKIPQGWVDHMTVYFSFPLDAPECNVKYNFEIRKDGVVYGSKQVLFNLV